MTVVALSHGYPPLWNMGGEVSLHRTMTAIGGKRVVLTNTQSEYYIDGVRVVQIDTPDVLNIDANPVPIIDQLRDLRAKVVIAQNELSLPAVLAAEAAGAVSIVSVHTPPKYGKNIRQAVVYSDYALYNTETSAMQWGEPGAMVVHPPINPLPEKKAPTGDAYTVLSSLVNKGVEVVLELAKLYPDKRFIIVRSPAEPTHGLSDIEERVRLLPNVELHPRVSPNDVHKYFEQTRILLVPSRYETYGMSAIEAAGYGIPTVHVDTPHVREGIGEAAILVSPLSVKETANGIDLIESNYEFYSNNARVRAEWLQDRQEIELQEFAEFIKNINFPQNKTDRQRSVARASRMNRYAS
jgi:glycosyltransferase involved in cell wall biosynthesis